MARNAAFALLCLAGGCGGDPEPGSDTAGDLDCARKPARTFEKSAVIDVDGDPPCRLVFRKTGVRLTAVADGSRPDPGRIRQRMA